MKKNEQSFKKEINSIKQVNNFIKIDKQTQKMPVDANKQAKLVTELFAKKVISLTCDGEGTGYNFAYCILQAKIIKKCHTCSLNYQDILKNNISTAELASFLQKKPRTIHCLNCNYHELNPHACYWCISMLW